MPIEPDAAVSEAMGLNMMDHSRTDPVVQEAAIDTGRDAADDHVAEMLRPAVSQQSSALGRAT